MCFLWMQRVKRRVTESKRIIYGLFNDVTSSGYGDNLRHPPGYISLTQVNYTLRIRSPKPHT